MLEPQDSTNHAYDHVKTRPMRHSTCYVEKPVDEQSSGGYVHMYEIKITGPVGMAQ